ncbi:hypothetical protein Abr02nite_04860 [Paractinoplanes brasiliensis]|nr:hypothetical protein Abr02nite_04860 [Actinoplanes brasiliensis]
MFPVRLGVEQATCVDALGPRSEPPLRAADPQNLPGEQFPMQRREPMNGVSLWHGGNGTQPPRRPAIRAAGSQRRGLVRDLCDSIYK